MKSDFEILFVWCLRAVFIMFIIGAICGGGD
jgi:hypothetical protein